jgi:hypothetical protein
MSISTLGEQQVLELLRQVPAERWPDVLGYLSSLIPAEEAVQERPQIRTAADLVASEVVGAWSGRTDLGAGREFAQKLRQQAEQRRGTGHAAGH